MAAGLDTLVVAPLAEELSPFLRAIGARRVRRPGEVSLYRGRVGGREVAAAVIGDGAARARRALEGLVGSGRPRRGLLLGVAGGLSPDLGVGATVRVTRVAVEREGSPRWMAEGHSGEEGGTALSARRVVTAAAEKQELWRWLGSPPRAVVDLESAVFVEVMRASGAAWGVIRAIVDAADEDLPAEIAAASDADGHVRRARLVAELARRPWRLGKLLALRRRVRLCAERLAALAVEELASRLL